MNTKTMDNRWVVVPKLTLWAINRLNKMCEYFAENQLPTNGAPRQQQASNQRQQNYAGNYDDQNEERKGD